MAFELGKCPVAPDHWHDWRNPRMVLDYQVEDCKHCGKREGHKILPDGSMADSDRYYEMHIRDFCQPYGRTHKIFIEIYGLEHLRKLEKDDEELQRRKRDYEASEGEFAKHMTNTKTIFT